MRPLNDAEIPVSGTDELAVERGEKAEHIRRFGEYKSTNTPLSEQELKDLAARLGGITGKIANVELRTDSSLLGGIVVQVGSTIFDGSIRTQLEEMKRLLAET